MGFIRGSLLVIAGVVLFLCFLMGNTFLVLSSSLEYDNLHPELTNVAKEFLEDQIGLEKTIISQKTIMETYCKINSEYIISQEGYVITLPCETIIQNPENIVNEGINQLIEQIYYKNYECELFFDCNKKMQHPFFLISEQAKDYWKEKFYLFLGTSLLLIILMFILTEHRLELPIKIGMLLTISSLPFLKLESVLSFFDFPLMQFVTVFFSQSQAIFWKIFIIGISILIIGLIIKLFKIGFKLNKWFGKKDEEKEEKVVEKKKIKEEPKKTKRKSPKPIQNLIDKIKIKSK